jgi:hypothetical protein
MENLHIKETKHSPEINLNINGNLSLTGRSFPENTFEFYSPMISWIKDYFNNNAADTTTIDLNITYCNSGSTMLFFDLFDLLLKYNENYTTIINWHYDEENDTMEEMGIDIKDDFSGLNINLIIDN